VARALDPDRVPEVPHPSPRRAPPLAAALEPWAQETPPTGAELPQAGRVPGDALVVVVPAPRHAQTVDAGGAGRRRPGVVRRSTHMPMLEMPPRQTARSWWDYYWGVTHTA
jgi:hypothetical protein